MISWQKDSKANEAMGMSQASQSFTRRQWQQSRYLIDNCRQMFSTQDYYVMRGVFNAIDEYRIASSWYFSKIS